MNQTTNKLSRLVKSIEKRGKMTHAEKEVIKKMASRILFDAVATDYL